MGLAEVGDLAMGVATVMLSPTVYPIMALEAVELEALAMADSVSNFYRLSP